MSECLNQPKYKPLSARILRCVLGCRTQPHKWELRFASRLFIRIFAHECRDILKGYGYDVFYEEIPGYAHEWDFWDLALRKALDEWLPIRHDVLLPEQACLPTDNKKRGI